MIVDASRDMRSAAASIRRPEMGPLVSADAAGARQRYVGIGRDEGAELALGGARHGDRGYFHEPTVFTASATT